MPQLIIPLVIGIGTSLISRAFTPKPPDLSGMTQQATPSTTNSGDLARQAMAERMSKARSIRQQLPSLQEQVGGSVSPEYYAQMAALLSGNADQGNLARDETNNWMGLGGDASSDMSGISSSPGFGGMGGGGMGGWSDVGGITDLVNGANNFSWTKLGDSWQIGRAA